MSLDWNAVLGMLCDYWGIAYARPHHKKPLTINMDPAEISKRMQFYD